MAADPWSLYDALTEYTGDGSIDLDAGSSGTFSVVLVTSAYTPASTHDTYADISTSEVANGDGYTTGGDILEGITWTRSGDTTTFSSSNPTWTGSGSGFSAYIGVLTQIGAGSGVPQSTDKIMAYCQLDNTPAPVTVASGADLVISLPAGGYFTVAPSTT